MEYMLEEEEKLMDSNIICKTNTASQNGVDFVSTPYNPNFESFPKEKQIIFFVCTQFNWIQLACHLEDRWLEDTAVHCVRKIICMYSI